MPIVEFSQNYMTTEKCILEDLTRDRVLELLDQLMDVSRDVSDWGTGEFLFELPDKYRLSFFVWDKGLAGYAIMSRKWADRVHIHQFMVHPSRRNSGFGQYMLDEATRRAAGDPLSLKVSISNSGAIRFYERHGFQIEKMENQYHWMLKKPLEAPVTETLASIACERDKRISARLNQGAGSLVNFRRLVEDAVGASDHEAISKALDFAADMDYQHVGLSSASYLTHPLRVTEMILSLVPGAPVETMIIAMLHNVLEVGNVTEEELEQRFGTVVLQSLINLTVDRELQWDAAYKRSYYQRLSDGYHGARIVKVMDKLDNMFVLGLNPNKDIRRRYLEEIETYVLPMARHDIPSLAPYLTDLIDDCRRNGYLAQDAARISSAEEY